MSDFEGFPKGARRFLRELAKHNDRAWFDANKQRFETEVRGPALELVRALQPRLAGISPHLVASDKKAGGSLMRLNRDVRFSKDKSPYRTDLGFRFWHDAGRQLSAPGFYLQVAAEGVMLGTGIYQPDTPTTNRIRGHLVANTSAWCAARDDAAFAAAWGGLDGESLKRPPRGFPADHPEVEDLKRKDFVSFAKLPGKACERDDFVDLVLGSYASSTPLMRFLCGALDLPF